MKPTQEQIDAALRFASHEQTFDDRQMLRQAEFERSGNHSATESVIQILAAAYREKCEELARAKETYAQRIAREYPKSKHP